MALSDYLVVRDHFEAEDRAGLSFPCCACIHQHGSDKDEPCIRCDWNSNALPDSAPAAGGQE